MLPKLIKTLMFPKHFYANSNGIRKSPCKTPDGPVLLNTIAPLVLYTICALLSLYSICILLQFFLTLGHTHRNPHKQTHQYTITRTACMKYQLFHRCLGSRWNRKVASEWLVVAEHPTQRKHLRGKHLSTLFQLYTARVLDLHNYLREILWRIFCIDDNPLLAHMV